MPDTELGVLPDGTTVFAASLATGRELLTTVDPNIQNQSPFDRQSRVESSSSVDQAAYLDFLAQQVMEWSPNEIVALSDQKKGIIASIDAKFKRLDFPLPKSVWLVKTTGREQGKAAYTRQLNVIALPVNSGKSRAPDVNNLHSSLLHQAIPASFSPDTSGSNIGCLNLRYDLARGRSHGDYLRQLLYRCYGGNRSLRSGQVAVHF